MAGHVALFVAALSICAAASPDALPSDFVRLAEVDASIVQELRYATRDNFTGAPLPGYEEPACWLTRPAAEALKAVQARLAPFGLGLKVYDCYRPERAVRALAAWAQHPRQQGRAQEFLGKGIKKEEVFARGYIAMSSAHCRGSTVDLTLIDRSALGTPRATKLRRQLLKQRCDRQGDVANTFGLDFGTRYDCLGPRSHTREPSVSATARAHRMLLWHLMRHAGFVGYPKEWWHFRLANEPYPTQSFDTPLQR